MVKETIEDKLEYLGLDLSDIPDEFKDIEPLEFRVPKFYDEKQQYKQYRYIPVKDIQILLSPTNRLDEIGEKYGKARPLIDYLDNQREENFMRHTTFLKMLKHVKIEQIEKMQIEQNNLNQKIPFKVKFEGNYLWQIYYSENTDKYFMLVPTEDEDYSAFFYLLKKQLDSKRAEKIFVPIRNVTYSQNYLKKVQFENVENYLWLFTKDWPLIYEVYDQEDNLSIQIIGETEVFEKIKSPYKIQLNSKEEANKFYKLLKAMFILQTELPHYFHFNTIIGKNGQLEFCIDDKKIAYRNLVSWINYAYKKGQEAIQDTDELIHNNNIKLENLKETIATQEIEYLAKEKQISTFLACKKTFFGKFKYYFKYSKKRNKVDIKEKFEEDTLVEQETKKKNKARPTQREFLDKKHYTIEELLDLYQELERLENELKNLVLDINSLKLKEKNMSKKLENASLFIQEIDSHKKSIFEFWRYSNKDEMESLPEGEEEQINIMPKITKVFDYKEDLEKIGKMMDKIQRRCLSKTETDSVFIATTNLLEILNQVKTNTALPKDITISLRNLKKEAISKKILTEDEEFDIFGGKSQDMSKVSKINNKKHREIAKDKYTILEISKTTKSLGYKLSLEKIINHIKKSLEKVVISEDIPIYKAMQGKLLDERELNVFNMNPEQEMNEIKEKDTEEEGVINFYKIYAKKGTNAISFTNSIFYDNQNKTLPIGQDLSSKILVDVSKMEMNLKKKASFQIVDFEDKESDFSEVIIKKIKVFEYE